MEPAWTRARAVFLGLGGVTQDLAKGLELARQCHHADAVWLCSMFPDGPPGDRVAARELLLRQGGDDPRAQCFAVLVSKGMNPPTDAVLLTAAARRGDPLAMAMLSQDVHLEPEERHVWACRAAAAGEPQGLCELGTQHWYGFSCAQDRPRALQLYRAAAELGDASAMLFYAKDALAEEDPERCACLGRAAAAGSTNAALLLIEETQRRFADYARVLPASAQCVFELGAAYRGHIVGKKLFGVPVVPDKLAQAARAVALHAEWCEQARCATEAWLWVARKKGVVKDIRGSIAKLLWAQRAAWAKGKQEKKQRK